MAAKFTPIRFVDEEIQAFFDRPPDLTKKPGPPNAFLWKGERHAVAEMLASWTDYRRRGRMAQNMGQAHLKAAERHGSWGVGRLYFRLRTRGERIFDLYYDRAPNGAGDRAGHWFLYRELRQERG